MDDREDRIRQRAYEIWEKEGRPEGRHDQHWSQAETEDRPSGDMPPDDMPAPGGIPSRDDLRRGDRLDTAADRARDAVSETAPEGAAGESPDGLGTRIGTNVAEAQNMEGSSPNYGENLDYVPDDRADRG
ncbi:DUF2934 domain-containing protein [Arenibaculum pallidiluteum]|uniref:DUF2934 domain-containing protein n=1 Tax=Arenibaculum pallidiluteum TaxID=2812559 RepID=UPI001A9798AC|nr:DUF2934 domain-containing protein [Arenibaculum pallidiluteum]